MDPVLKKAIDLSLADMASRNKDVDGARTMSLEAAVSAILPNFNNMSEEEAVTFAIERSKKEQSKGQINEEVQVNLAIELSKQETAKERIVSKEEEEELLRNAIRESLELANQCREDLLENVYENEKTYQMNFQRVLADNAEVPKTGSRKRKVKSGLPLSRSTSSSPGNFTRIQGEQKEEEDYMEAVRRSLAEAVENGISVEPEPEVVDISDEAENEDLKLAIELSKRDFSRTPPALDPPLPSPRASRQPKSEPLSSSSKLPTRYVLGSASGPSRILPRTFKENASRNIHGKKKGDRRPIVVDGCNVGWNYGRNIGFNAYGLTILFNYFIGKGWQKDEIVIFLKRPQMSEEDHACCESLAALGVLKYTPKRVAGNQRIVCDDDDMIIDYANQCGGIIVSNDHYRDSYKVNPEFRDTITNRVLQANFINDKILFSRRPLGPDGPALDEFLRF